MLSLRGAKRRSNLVRRTLIRWGYRDKFVAELNKRQLLFGLQLLVNIALPWCIYWLTKPRIGEVHAIIAAAVPPMAWSVAEFVRRRTLDAMSLLVLGGIGLSLAGFALGGSPRLLLMRESLITGLIGLAFLASVLIGRPLVEVLARAALARQAAIQGTTEEWEETPAMRRAMKVMTAVWGCGFVAETCLRVGLVFSLPVGSALVAGPVVGYTAIGLLVGWTWLYGKRLE